MDAKLTQDELRAIKERAEKATEGEWKTDEHRVYSEVVADDYICEIWSSFDDAEFIANARQDIPKLVAEVERLQSLLGELLENADYPETIAKMILTELNGGDDD